MVVLDFSTGLYPRITLGFDRDILMLSELF